MDLPHGRQGHPQAQHQTPGTMKSQVNDVASPSSQHAAGTPGALAIYPGSLAQCKAGDELPRGRVPGAL